MSYDNPFAVSAWTEGRIPYRSPDGRTIAGLADTVLLGGRFEVVGPHGSGKTTLLGELTRELVARGARVLRLTYRDRGRRAERLVVGDDLGGAPRRVTVVLVDGYEQLGRLARALLLARTALVAAVVVTVHRSCGLTELERTRVTPEVLRHVLRRLVGEPGDALAGQAEDSLATHAGDLREVLFDLYDRAHTDARARRAG